MAEFLRQIVITILTHPTTVGWIKGKLDALRDYIKKNWPKGK